MANTYSKEIGSRGFGVGRAKPSSREMAELIGAGCPAAGRERGMPMLFVALYEVRAGTEEERIARRLEWELPEGITIEAEFWLHTPVPEVIFVFAADSFADMLQITGAWNDLYDISIFPAVRGEDGMDMARQMMQ